MDILEIAKALSNETRKHSGTRAKLSYQWRMHGGLPLRM